MTPKKSKRTESSQTTAKLWGELSDLCRKTRYWLYTRKDKTKALPYAERMQTVLRRLPANRLAIVREEALALMCELKGQVGEAIAHRQREINLMIRLHDEAGLPRYDESTRAYLLRGRDTADIKQRRSIVESLQNGQVHVAEQRRLLSSRRA